MKNSTNSGTLVEASAIVEDEDPGNYHRPLLAEAMADCEEQDAVHYVAVATDEDIHPG